MAGYWGGELNASTRLLDDMHHHGWLRVRRRESGTRLYEAMSHVEQDESPSAAWPARKPWSMRSSRCTRRCLHPAWVTW